jgi:hypothetical protein
LDCKLEAEADNEENSVEENLPTSSLADTNADESLNNLCAELNAELSSENPKRKISEDSESDLEYINNSDDEDFEPVDDFGQEIADKTLDKLCAELFKKENLKKKRKIYKEPIPFELEVLGFY